MEKRQLAEVDAGFAADVSGNGMALARVSDGEQRERLLRIPFSVPLQPALLGHDVAYAALTAVADAVRSLGYTRAVFHFDDDRVPVDLACRRSLPRTLALPYVRVRCALNRFRSATVSAATANARALTEQARAGMGLLIAA